MRYPTSPTSENKARDPTVRWLARLIKAAGDYLFAADDRAATHHGWQITARHSGLGRRYRDPRFDTLRACPRCNGSGETDHAPCDSCSGAGRVAQAVSYRQRQCP